MTTPTPLPQTADPAPPMGRRSFWSRLSPKVSLGILMFLTLGGIAAFAILQGIDRYPLDDAYIVQHSVQGILIGSESRFLGSSPYDGVTSPIFVLLIALLSLVLPIPLAHWLVQAASLLAFAVGVFVLGRQKDLSGPMSLLLSLIALISGMMIYHAFNGLETGMAMAAVTWMLAALESEKPPKAGYVLAGLLCFIRPELAALAGLAFLHILRMKPFRRPEGWKAGFALAFGAFLSFVLLWTALSGAPIPNTVSAKQYFFADGCLPFGIKARMLGLVTLSFLSVYGMSSVGFLFLGKSKKCGAVLFFFAAAFLSAYFLKSPGSIARNGQRYMYVLAPLALLGTASVIRSFLERPIQDWRRFAFSWGLLLVLALHAAFKLPERMEFLAKETAVYADHNRAAARWMEAHVPEGKPVLIHDAGGVSLTGSHPLVDMVGLKTRFSVEVHRDITWKTCGEGMPEALDIIARHFGTEYALIEDLFDSENLLKVSLEKAGWRLELMSGELGDNPYKVYRLQPPASAKED